MSKKDDNHAGGGQIPEGVDIEEVELFDLADGDPEGWDAEVEETEEGDPENPELPEPDGSEVEDE